MKTIHWMMTLALATALGCGAPVSKDNNEPDPDPDEHDYQEVTFTVTNQSRSSVFVDQTKPAFTVYHGNDAYQLASICNSGGTRVSALEAAGAPFPDDGNAAPIEPSTELRPGQQWSQFWNGIVVGEGSCPNLTHLLGEELVVEFCYGMNIEGSDEWSAFPTDIECARQSFTFSDDAMTVEIDLETEVVEGATMPIVIENRTNDPIFVQLSDDCGANTFYTITHDGQQIGHVDLCGPCDCSEGADCGIACDLACAAPTVAAIENGATFARDLSLTYRKLYDEGSYQCSQVQYVPIGPLTATICYGLDATVESENFGNITSEICQDIVFSTTDDEVRLVVQ